MDSPRGFTLIELMVVVGILGIVMAFAIPAYGNQVRKSRRADAVNVLGQMALAQERIRADNPAYSLVAATLGGATTSYYSFAATTPTGNCASGVACTTANCFTLTADTTGTQTADDGTCATIVFSNRCGVVTRTSTPAGGSCWSQ